MANEFEEVGREGGIQKPRWVQTTNDWWLAVHRWRICFFQISHFIVVYNKRRPCVGQARQETRAGWGGVGGRVDVV